MTKVIRINKGFDIKLPGNPQKDIESIPSPKSVAVKPTDYIGIAPIPKVIVKEGDSVKAGDAIFFDKSDESMKFTSPTSGTVRGIVRGAKRAVSAVVIDADGKGLFKEFPIEDPSKMERKAIISRMKEAGVWPSIIERPYGVIANTERSPKSIFISGFNTAPNAADVGLIARGNEEFINVGITALEQLTNGTVYIGLPDSSEKYNSKNIEEKVNCGEFVTVSGDQKHPAGNVGTHIHHVDPIGKGDIVWTLSMSNLITIGKLFAEGKYDTERVVAISGPEIEKPIHVKTVAGADIRTFIEKGGLKQDHVRIVSGDLLTGENVGMEGYLGMFHNQVSAVAEGDQYEFMGWQMPMTPRPSMSRTFLSTWATMFGSKVPFDVSTNLRGEERAIVVTGQYEEVVPMDVLPQHLIKSIMYKDIEQMEGLGIYEVLEEDLALCEFVCTSKIQVTELLREGLDLVRKEG